MNEHSLNDPQLQSLEARLSAMAPQLPPSQQQQLLYECGLAAGRATLRRSILRWQASAATLLVVSIAVSMFAARGAGSVMEQPTDSFVVTDIPYSRDFVKVSVETRQSSAVDLEAWQAPSSDATALADDLARFQENEPHLRSLAVGALTRAVLSHN